MNCFFGFVVLIHTLHHLILCSFLFFVFSLLRSCCTSGTGILDSSYQVAFMTEFWGVIYLRYIYIILLSIIIWCMRVTKKSSVVFNVSTTFRYVSICFFSLRDLCAYAFFNRHVVFCYFKLRIII